MILMVDDNVQSNYKEELRLSNFDFSFQNDVDIALRFFENDPGQISLLILDIKMPPGDSFKHEETQNGLRTGVFFYERIRRKMPDLPVVILTIHSDEGLSNRFRGENKCWFYRKAEFLPHEFVEKIKEVLFKSKTTKGGHHGN